MKKAVFPVFSGSLKKTGKTAFSQEKLGRLSQEKFFCESSFSSLFSFPTKKKLGKLEKLLFQRLGTDAPTSPEKAVFPAFSVFPPKKNWKNWNNCFFTD